MTVESIAAKGDGTGTGEDGARYFVPYTLPGERVLVRPGRPKGEGVAGTVEEWLDRAPERAAPFCPHFGVCGGCAVQHLPGDAYRTWKRDLVAGALERRGFSRGLVAEPLEVSRNARRRATFAFVRTGSGLMLGFQKRASHDIVDINECPLLVPGLAGALTQLRTLLAMELTDVPRGRLAVTAAGSAAAPALDLLIEADNEPGLAEREAIAAFAAERDLARVSWRQPGTPPEPVTQRRSVEVAFAGLTVALPAGSFLQPSSEGEAHLRKLVETGVAETERIADLFCGLGTFALPLARGAHVAATDGDPAAIAALRAAAGTQGLGGRLTAEVRDLAQRPVTAAELDQAGIQAAVFDPPRAGAAEQAREIAASTGVSRVVGVSCNPGTFGRDARILADGGFTLESVTPLDQFPFSHHVELVGHFRRR